MQTIEQIPSETEEIEEFTDEQLTSLAMAAPEIAPERNKSGFPWRRVMWTLVVFGVLGLGGFVLLAAAFIPAC